MPIPHKSHLPPPFHRFDARQAGALPSLAMNRLLGYTATNIIGIFFPIFIYELFGQRLDAVFLWFAVAWLAHIPFYIWGAKLFARLGLLRSMVLGTFAWIAFYLGAFVLDSYPDFSPTLMLAAVIAAMIVFHIFYWPPFHVDFAKFSTKGRRGRQIGTFYALQLFIGVTMPVFGGFIISRFSYDVAFILAMAVIGISLMPLFFLPHDRVEYEFGFFETFRKMLSRRYRPLTVSMASCGAEDMIGYVVWPIFLFTILGGRHLDVGIFTTVMVLAGVLLQFSIGRWLDSRRPERVLPWGVRLFALGWFSKAFANTAFGAFVVSTLHNFGSIVMRTPLSVMVYDRTADSGHLADELTVMREIALSFGRGAIMLVLIAVTAYLPLASAFVIAALLSLGVSWFARQAPMSTG